MDLRAAVVVSLCLALGGCRQKPTSDAKGAVGSDTAPTVAPTTPPASPPQPATKPATEEELAEARKEAEKAKAEEQRRLQAEAAAEQAAYKSAVRKLVADEGGETPLRDTYAAGDVASEKLIRRIRFQLRPMMKVPVALRSVLVVPTANGGGEVFATYETSVYEECLLGYPTRAAGRSECARRERTRGCVKHGVVWANVGPPPPDGVLGESGKLEARMLPLDSDECFVKEERLLAGDLDDDGVLEAALDVIYASEPPEDNRGRWNHFYARDAVMVRSGLAAEQTTVVRVAGWETGHGQDGLETGEDALFLRDLDGKAPAELVVYTPTDLDTCSESRKENAEEGSCDRQARAMAALFFDAAADVWALATREKLEALKR